MLHKIKSSLAYRLPGLYKKLLRFRRVGQIPLKPVVPITVLMMTGRGFILMTRLTVLSIARNWDSLPRLIISTDGTIDEAKIRSQLAFWQGELLISVWAETQEYHRVRERNALVSYAAEHVFGKKLAVILRYGESGPVLWVDSDILFYQDFLPFLPVPVTGFACGGTEDFTPAYHRPVLNYFGNNLYDRYQFNAGLLYFSGEGIYEGFDLEHLLYTLHPGYDFCTEQSIFAHIASTSFGILWTRDIVKTYYDDDQQVCPMPVHDVYARHYTSNVRHLFWRDAFFHL